MLSVEWVARKTAPNKQGIAMKKSITPPAPLILKIAIAVTFLNTLVIVFVWPGLLLRICP